MKKRTPVSDIMTKKVIALRTSDDLEKAESL
ncbi:MAG TPA: CBS domain-containing protein, partial [Flavobacteriaceae bacterium]|nr:CBS domain-containing protein [Flavobacteriaceae bacterium]